MGVWCRLFIRKARICLMGLKRGGRKGRSRATDLPYVVLSWKRVAAYLDVWLCSRPSCSVTVHECMTPPAVSSPGLHASRDSSLAKKASFPDREVGHGLPCLLLDSACLHDRLNPARLS